MKNKNIFLKLCYQVSPFYFWMGFFLVLASGVLAAFMVKVYSKYIDLLIQTIKQKDIYRSLVCVFLLFIIMKAYEQFNWVLLYYTKNKFRLNVQKKILQTVVEKVERLEYENLENPELLALMHRVKRGVETVNNNIEYVMDLLYNMVSMIGLIILLTGLGIVNVLLLIAILIIVMILSYLCSNHQYRYIFDYSETDRKVDYIEQLLTSKDIVPETKIFNTLDFFRSIYTKNMDRSTQIWNKQIRLTRPIEEFLIPLIGDGFILFTYIMFLIPLKNGEFTIGFYISMINMVVSILYFISREMPIKIKSLFVFKKYMEDFNKLYNWEEKEKQLHPYDLDHVTSVEFKDVYFRYPNSDIDILKGLSLRFSVGKHYAIIGENGAGKTTIIKLMCGLYKPTKGEIRINGININEFSDSQLSHMISVVFQDFSRYSVTIKEFILLKSNQPFDYEKADRIAKILDLYDLIHQMKSGYDTMLGTDWKQGVDLSGGQWQKLAIFRLLYQRSLIQILDEPTASLDPASESRIYHIYENNSQKNVLTLFISHRLASTKFIDEILLIQDGKVKEKGTHSQLMQLKEEYHHMFQAQKQWYLQDEVIKSNFNTSSIEVL